jgi:hypothetical protein
MELDSKNWWASKGVWGGIMAVLAAIAGVFGLKFGVDLQEQTVTFITQIMGAAGGLLAIWGRVSAKQPIGSVPGPDLRP